MNGVQKTYALPRAIMWLACVCMLVFGGLTLWSPTVDGVLLRDAELTLPLNRLRANEYLNFYLWLGADTLFALLYTILFSGLLRWRAANAPDAWSFIGRCLSWVTALAVVFDLAENAILWTAASMAASHVSPWLHFLVYLKWLPLMITVSYVAIGTACGAWTKDTGRTGFDQRQ